MSERIDSRTITLKEVVYVVNGLNVEPSTVAQEALMINRLRGVFMLWTGGDPGYHAFNNICDVYDALGVHYKKIGDMVYSEFDPEYPDV